ncbi:MAG: AIPR family protein, partial [Burkholderiales bacterium]
MGTSTHRFRVYEARRTTHPVLPEIEKFWFTVAAAEFPKNISTKANARDPVGLNRRVYRDVRESLIGNAAAPGTFDLMNKGITLLATKVKLVDKERGLYDVSVDDEEGGIVDGAHTAKLIEEAQEDGGIPAEQHVEVYIRTGIK